MDLRAASIDWDDPGQIVSRSGQDTVTVADARAEVDGLHRDAWPSTADYAYGFGALYLRARYPELVREYGPEATFVGR